MFSVVVKAKPKGSQKKPIVVVVGSKALKKATERNLLKRRIRAILRPLIKEAQRDFLVIVRQGAEKRTYRELKKEILRNVAQT